MMRKVLVLAAAVLALVIFSCQLHDEEAQVVSAVETANAGAVDVLDLVIHAKAAQDFSALEDFLAEEDRDGELRALLAAEGVFAPPVQAKAIADYPGGPSFPTSFADGAFANGDVLLSRSSGTWTSNLMSLVLNKGYGHGGILYQNLASETDPNAGCVLSADLEGLNFQSYLEWQAADSIAVMRDNTSLGLADRDLTGVLYEMPFPYTCYSFLLPEFMPVTREDDYFWYCSKVPYRVYRDLGEDIENSAFYELGDPGGKWAELRDSLLYKVYKLYLTWSLPWWKWRQIPALADAQLRLVLGELVTPDELRWSAEKLEWIQTYGDDSPDKDWDD